MQSVARKSDRLRGFLHRSSCWMRNAHVGWVSSTAHVVVDTPASQNCLWNCAYSIMDGGFSASAVSSVLSSALRFSQVIYELAAVGEQARDLLATTKHVNRSLETTRALRRQKSSSLETEEKKWIDGVILDAAQTLVNVAALVEPVRVDMDISHGRISLLNRGLFVLRDSPKIPTQLTKLSITSDSLTAALSTLAQRAGYGPSHWDRPSPSQTQSNLGSPQMSTKRLPSYEESEFLNRRRKYPGIQHMRDDSQDVLSTSSHQDGQAWAPDTPRASERADLMGCQPPAMVSRSSIRRHHLERLDARHTEESPSQSSNSSPMMNRFYGSDSYASNIECEQDREPVLQGAVRRHSASPPDARSEDSSFPSLGTPQSPQGPSYEVHSTDIDMFSPGHSARHPTLFEIPHLPGQSGLDIWVPNPTPTPSICSLEATQSSDYFGLLRNFPLISLSEAISSELPDIPLTHVQSAPASTNHLSTSRSAIAIESSDPDESITSQRRLISEVPDVIALPCLSPCSSISGLSSGLHMSTPGGRGSHQAGAHHHLQSHIRAPPAVGSAHGVEHTSQVLQAGGSMTPAYRTRSAPIIGGRDRRKAWLEQQSG